MEKQEENVEGAEEQKKYESILCLESGLIHNLLNLAQQFNRFRKHHFADGHIDLLLPNLEFK